MDKLTRGVANYYLSDVLKAFTDEGERTRTRLFALESAAKGIQDALNTAIEDFPTQANAVMIRAVVDPKREPNIAWDSRTERRTLRDYIRLTSGSEELPDSVELTLVKHLPFTFTSERYRRSHYTPFQSIRVDVAVDFGKGPPEPYVAVDLADRGFADTGMYLFADEIKEIRLGKVPDEEFSPLMDSHDKRLQPASSAAAHYLRYRGFEKALMIVKDFPKDETRGKIAAIARNVLVPDLETGLLHIDYGNGLWGALGLSLLEYQALTGFAAHADPESPSGVVLYEFDNVRLPRGASGYDAVGIAHAIAMHNAQNQRGTTTYVGDAIVEKLSSISPFRNS